MDERFKKDSKKERCERKARSHPRSESFALSHSGHGLGDGLRPASITLSPPTVQHGRRLLVLTWCSTVLTN